jgi:hypothetical protein
MGALQLAEIPVGLCAVCGLLQYTQPHDHRPLQTLTPEQATAYWETRKGVYDDAPEPR